MFARIIAVLNQKGGVGKTTVTMHIAAALARQGFRVLIADADPQGTATRWAASAADDKPFPATVIGLAHAGGKIHRELKKFMTDYDFLIVDCPPAADSPVPQSVLLVAELAIVPLVPSPLDLWAAVAIRQVINSAMDFNEALIPRLLLNQVQTGTTLTTEIRAILPEFGIPLLTSQLGQRQVFRQAAAFGLSVFDLHNKPAIKEIDSLIHELLTLLNIPY